MEARLASGVLVSALIRKAEARGAHAAVLAKGDQTAGALLLVFADRGVARQLRERGLSPDGRRGWISAGASDLSDPLALGEYIVRRRRSDPDLWVLELDGISEPSLDDFLEGL